MSTSLTSAPKSRWRRICRQLPALFFTVYTALLAGLTYKLATWQDVRERTFRFHDLVLKADELYCETVTDGVSTKVKLFIDRAAKLEPAIRNELIAMDYVTLASVGSCFWSPDQTEEYGLRALEIGKTRNDRVEQYAANLVLGHLAFLRYKQSRLLADLRDGQQHFRQAETLIVLDGSPQNFRFSEQLYLQWGQDELYVGNAEDSKKAFDLVRNVWAKMPHSDTSEYSIRLAEQAVRDGRPPRLPCPSTITVAPAMFQNPSLQEAQHRVEIEPPTGSELPPDPRRSELDKLNERMSGVERSLETKGEELDKEIDAIRDHIESDRENNSDRASDEAKFPAAPQQNQHSAPEREKHSLIRRPPCTIRIYNNTKFYIRAIINGFDEEEYTVAPRQLRRFHVGNERLTLTRRDNGNSKSWDKSIFLKSDGSPAEPFFEITNCCFEIRSL